MKAFASLSVFLGLVTIALAVPHKKIQPEGTTTCLQPDGTNVVGPVPTNYVEGNTPPGDAPGGTTCLQPDGTDVVGPVPTNYNTPPGEVPGGATCLQPDGTNAVGSIPSQYGGDTPPGDVPKGTNPGPDAPPHPVPTNNYN